MPCRDWVLKVMPPPVVNWAKWYSEAETAWKSGEDMGEVLSRGQELIEQLAM